MRDYASYFLERTPPQKSGVSIQRDVDWWMEYFARRMGKLLFLGLLAILFLFLKSLWQVGMSDRIFPIHHITLTGQVLITKPSDIQKNWDDLGKNSLLGLNIRSATQKMEALPWVKKASITRQWPDSLIIHLVERTPAYRWGKNELIDKSGHRFRSNYNPVLSSLPLLMGADGHESEVVYAYQQLMQQLGDKAAYLGIAYFALNQYLSWELHLTSGLVVKFGRDNFKARLARFVEAYQQGDLPKLAKIDLIDLRYQKGFSVRWKPGYQPGVLKQPIVKVSAEQI